MQPKTIEYNRLFEVIREENEWILPKRKNWKNTPIFDLDGKRWCSIEKSKNNQWFILFYKDEENKNNPVYYKSFVRAREENLILLFNVFNEVIKDTTGRWITRIGSSVEKSATIRQE